MKLLRRNEIDPEKWDQKIGASPIENIFCYSWYLDAVAENWSAIVSENYNTILPLPFTHKLGIDQLYQPPFTRELDIFGNDFIWEDVIPLLTQHFKALQFRNREQGILGEGEERKHQWIPLNPDEIKYSTNAKRLIKKAAKQFNVQEGQQAEQLIELFKENVWSKVKMVSTEDLTKLTGLMQKAISNGRGELLKVNENGNLIAAAFFLKDKKRITYLKGAATEEGKKSGAMYGIIDAAIKRYMDNYEMLDFGGSDVENVAIFYKKFGAHDRTYYNYTLDHLPLWYKTLKKIKR
ncbi:MAG: GNAT family N-acetyltransferase [Crocinitomicaceae bacterium]